jgi:heat shock protein HslJ/photosystem II stability/assembly factor-like uncharacterized protein
MQLKRHVLLAVILLAAALFAAGCTPAPEGETPGAAPTNTAAPATESPGTPVPLTPTTVPGETETPSPTAPAGDPGGLAGTDWALISFGLAGEEESVAGDSQITLSFEEGGQAGGSGGCNSYGGSYRVEGDNLSFDEIVSTLRACADDSVNDQEGRYLAALGSASTFAIEGDNLTISYDDGQGTLNFVREGTATPVGAGGMAVQLRELHMIDTDNGWALGQVGDDPAEQVLFTADGGASWQVRTPPGALAPGASLEQTISAGGAFESASDAWVSYLLPAPVPAGATPVVWMTADSGENWEAGAPLDLSGMPYEHFVPSDLGFLDNGFGWMLAHLGVGMSHDYIAIYTTDDGGANWRRVADPESVPDIQPCNKSGLVFTGETDGWLSGDCPGLMPQLFFYRTTDGGATWTPVLLPLAGGQTAAGPEQLGDSCGVRQLVTAGEETVLLALHCFDFETNASQAWLYRSDDGENWEAHPLPAANGLFDFVSAGEGWYLGAGEETGAAVYHTTDGGQSWEQHSELDRLGQVEFVDEENGWVLTGVGVGDAPELWRLSGPDPAWEQLSPVVTP